MILHFIITVLFIYGVHAITREGMIFGTIYNRVLLYISKWYNNPVLILKPLFDCTPCMALVYGTISFFIYGSYYTPILQSWTIWVMALSGFNYILNKILKK